MQEVFLNVHSAYLIHLSSPGFFEDTAAAVHIVAQRQKYGVMCEASLNDITVTKLHTTMTAISLWREVNYRNSPFIATV